MNIPILIADSGSTKTDWLLMLDEKQRCIVQTQGINPYYLSEEQIFEIITAELLPQMPSAMSQLSAIYFYGAGCRQDVSHHLVNVLHKCFKAQTIEVKSDILAVAHATCKHEAGIACILGTGSNSCLFDGNKIVSQTPSLGYVLGDEGSGTVLGKLLVGDVFKHIAPQNIIESFISEYQVDVSSLLNKVYKQQLPNRYLASFTKFLSKHIEEDYIQILLNDEFSRFIQRNLLAYDAKDLPVHFVGSIAHVFQKNLETSIRQAGLKMGVVMKSPLEGLAAYHLA